MNIWGDWVARLARAATSLRVRNLNNNSTSSFGWRIMSPASVITSNEAGRAHLDWDIQYRHYVLSVTILSSFSKMFFSSGSFIWTEYTSLWLKSLWILTFTNSIAPGITDNYSVPDTYSSITRESTWPFFVSRIISISRRDFNFNQSGYIGSSTEEVVETGIY